MNWVILSQSTLLLFAIVNPVGSLPIFLQLTDKMNTESKRRAFNTAVITSLAILFLFLAAGRWILTNFFQISLADLMAAGGLLLLIIAIDHLIFGALVKGVVSTKHGAHHIGAVPMACPMLAGPGAMMAVFVTYSKHGFLVAAASILAVLGITWLLFYFIDGIYRIIGEAVCLVLSKILCLFLAAIGIKLLMQGLSGYFL